MDRIYTVTCFDFARPNGGRTWGWFPTKEAAEESIRADNNDLIFESGTYQFALIEEVPYGIMGGLDERKTWWFQAELLENDTYEVTALEKEPYFVDGRICISMG